MAAAVCGPAALWLATERDRACPLALADRPMGHPPYALLIRLIEHRFGRPSDDVRARVMSADARTLSTWFERALSAESVDAVLH
jgi:hypothetical protein